MGTKRLWLFCSAIAVGLGVVGCGGGGVNAPLPNPGGNPPPATAGMEPLQDLGSSTYKGFTGGLYPNSSNAVPTAHHAAGLAQAQAIQPLDVNGDPSPSGKVVLVSIGMSNTTQEFCSGSSNPPCDAWTFMGRAAADPTVNRTTLVIINGAAGGRSADRWDSPADVDYDRIRDTRLIPAGLSERQVQAAWVKVANPGPTISLPSAQSDAFLLVQQLGNIARAMKVRYPHLRLVFFSSRIYGGFATTTLNPEPYAYESGFAVKWVIEAQISQMQNNGVVVDARAGDLNFNTVAPWLAWGSYLWADGTRPRSDGLIWIPADFEGDGTHPAESGESKVGAMLFDSFRTSPYTKCWFLTGGACP